MSDKFEALKAAADKYSVALKAHQETPKDFDVLVAWDTATSEINSLINNDEINIITALLAALEEKDQRIAELSVGNVGNALLERENHHVEVVANLTGRLAELHQRLQQPIKLRSRVFEMMNVGGGHSIQVVSVKAVKEIIRAAGFKAGVEGE